MKMKRYVVFGHELYEECGGMADFKDSFDSLDEVCSFHKNNPDLILNIVERDTWEEVSLNGEIIDGEVNKQIRYKARQEIWKSLESLRNSIREKD